MEILDIAKEAGEKAGEVAISYFNKKHTLYHKGHLSNFATEADLASEKVIFDIVQKNFPHHNFLSEEMGLVNKGGKYSWIVDPIDGTVAFSRGLPLWGVAIAVFKNNEPLIGIINLPALKEFYFCQKGKGAFLDGKRLKVNAISNLKKSLIQLEFHYPNTRGKQKFPFEKFFRQFPGVPSNFLSTVLDLTNITSGKTEGLIEETTNIWDVGAGALMIEEADGKVTDWEGKKIQWEINPDKKYNIIASNGHLHEKLIHEMREFKSLKV